MKNKYIMKYIKFPLVKIVCYASLTLFLKSTFDSTYLTLLLVFLLIQYILKQAIVLNNFIKYLDMCLTDQYVEIFLDNHLKLKYIDGLYLNGVKTFPISLNQEVMTVTSMAGESYSINNKDIIECGESIHIKKEKWDNHLTANQLVFYYSNGLCKKQEDIITVQQFPIMHNFNTLNRSYICIGEEK